MTTEDNDLHLKQCLNCKNLVMGSVEQCPYCGEKLFSLHVPASANFSFIPQKPQSTIQYDGEIETMPSVVDFSSTLSVRDIRIADLTKQVEEMRYELNVLKEEKSAKEGVPPSKLYLPDHVEQSTPWEVMRLVKQIQKCYEIDAPDACLVLLRKTLISAIKIKFYMKNKRNLIYDENGNRRRNWIGVAKQEGYLTQEIAKRLERFKIFGDTGTHDERIEFDRLEIAEMFTLVRLTLERFFREQQN